MGMEETAAEASKANVDLKMKSAEVEPEARAEVEAEVEVAAEETTACQAAPCAEAAPLAGVDAFKVSAEQVLEAPKVEVVEQDWQALEEFLKEAPEARKLQAVQQVMKDACVSLPRRWSEEVEDDFDEETLNHVEKLTAEDILKVSEYPAAKGEGEERERLKVAMERAAAECLKRSHLLTEAGAKLPRVATLGPPQLDWCAKPSEARRTAFRTQCHKTTLCFYNEKGLCQRGVSCDFAHGERELITKPDFTKTVLCRPWQMGKCSFSAQDCTFAHGKEWLHKGRSFSEATESTGSLAASSICGASSDSGESGDSATKAQLERRGGCYRRHPTEQEMAMMTRAADMQAMGCWLPANAAYASNAEATLCACGTAVQPTWTFCCVCGRRASQPPAAVGADMCYLVPVAECGSPTAGEGFMVPDFSLFGAYGFTDQGAGAYEAISPEPGSTLTSRGSSDSPALERLLLGALPEVYED